MYIKCQDCNEEYPKEVIWAGKCRMCGRFATGQETSCDIMNRVMIDFRNFNQEEFTKWITGNNHPDGMPDSFYRQYKALLKTKQERAESMNTERSKENL